MMISHRVGNSPSTCQNDDSFGPAVRGCRDAFDFTTKFEDIFLAIIPFSLFLCLTTVRLLWLWSRPRLTHAPALKILKLFISVLYTAVELVVLVLNVRQSQAQSVLPWSRAAWILALVAAASTVILSWKEHSRSPRASTLLSTYLFLTLLFDGVRLRTRWLDTRTRMVAIPSTVGIFLKFLMLLLESRTKTTREQRKQQSPEESSTIYSLGVFYWLNNLFLRGYRNILRPEDLYPLDAALNSKRLGAGFQEYLEKNPLRGRRTDLARGLLSYLRNSLLLPVAPRLALIGFQFCQPLLIQALLNHIKDRSDTTSRNIGYGLIGATVLTFGGIAISQALYWYFQERVMFMVRACLASSVYKGLTQARVSSQSVSVTLMSTDIDRVRSGFLFIHEFWANLIEVGLACWLLQGELGASFIMPIVVVAASGLGAYIVGRYLGPCQLIWMEAIQQRVGLTADVIAHMKSVKIAGLAGPVERFIQNLRLEELRVGGEWRLWLVVATVLSYVPLCISPILAFAATSNRVDTVSVFTSISYLSLLSTPLITLLQKLPQILASFTCLSRIQSFLEGQRQLDYRRYLDAPDSDAYSTTEGIELGTLGMATSPAISIKRGNLGWDSAKTTLSEINMAIPAGKITMIVGPIASGKSSLCHALLGELCLVGGDVALSHYRPSIGYCAQTPYLENGSIRENIIDFGQYDEKRYRRVIDATLLERDFAALPQGDSTIVGTGGITLSGGQRQRVSMARALYLSTDLFLFDDTLSGLDANTADSVFRRVLGPAGLIRQLGATAIYCTHSARHLPSADHIVALGSDGRIVEQGGFDELRNNGKYVAGLVEHLQQHEQQQTCQPSLTDSENPESIPRPLHSATPKTSRFGCNSQDASRQTGDLKVYKHYLGTMNALSGIGFLVCCLLWGFFSNFPHVWLNFWTEDLVYASHSKGYWIGLYGLLQTLGLASFTCGLLIVMTAMVRLSGAELHHRTLKTVVNAPLSLFATTDVGILTNLFSQDMTLIDGELPIAMLNLGILSFQVVGTAAVIAVSSPWLILTYPVMGFVLWAIQMFYLKTSRQLRLLDLEARSPLYSHFLETGQGIATIRALGLASANLSANHEILDASQRPAYLQAMVQRWLLFVLSVFVTVLATTVVVLATQLRNSSAGTVGVSLVSLMSLGMTLSSLIKTYTAMETSIGAVSRLRQFEADTKGEHQLGDTLDPPESWPGRGEVLVRGVSASYDIQSDKQNLVLKNLEISIMPGQKVAICGRTGSGKSSLVLLLLRLLDPVHDDSGPGGLLSIDGSSLAEVDRTILRQRIIAIPQDAVFLPGDTSFQLNLDPSGTAGPADCRSVLALTGLWSLVEEQGGLGAAMNPGVFSQGQRQMFSLARAVLRKRIRDRSVMANNCGGAGGILLLDEYSSSVDAATDRTMQRIIREEFQMYTVIMISHRLDMVLEHFDQVLVMDQGRIVESGDPRLLSKIQGSQFRGLVEASTSTL